MQAKWKGLLGASLLACAMFLTSSMTALAAPAYGRLSVQHAALVGGNGQPAVLHGMSTHGMQWYGQFANAGAFRTLKSRGANVVRIAMYTDEGGYLTNPSVKEAVYRGVDAAIAADMYAIVDWHILHDGNPAGHEQEAASFFREVSQRYGDNPSVIYEICNEPNGNVTWSGDIKPYAGQIIPVIRANAPHAVIIVGTPTWSQDVDKAAADPLPFADVLYACHFYAGTHGQWLRDKISTARNRGAAVFVSEWGTSAADGNGGVYLDQAGQWLTYMAANNISWCNWSLCDKNESSAALKPGASPDGGWTEEQLSESGKYVFSHF